MSNSPISSNPRLLLFPQVDRPESQGGRPVVRRYSLTLLSGRRDVRLPRVSQTAGPHCRLSPRAPQGLTVA